jgi:hypothetical protein
VAIRLPNLSQRKGGFITEEGRLLSQRKGRIPFAFYHRGREVFITEVGANSIRFLSQRERGFFHRGRGEFHSLFYHRGSEVFFTEVGANSIHFLSQRERGFYHRGRCEFHSLFITEEGRFFSQR